MPIVVPGRRIGSAYASASSAVKKKLSHGKKSVNAALMLTPMVDMFVILVLYLIQSFSATGQILFIDPDMKLPEAMRAVDLVGNPPVVTITKDVISVQGKPVEPTETLRKDGYWAAPKLEEQLKQMRDLSNRLANVSQGQIATESSKGVLLVQADITVPYILVKKVLFTANKIGYTQVNFAVSRAAAQPVAAATH